MNLHIIPVTKVVKIKFLWLLLLILQIDGGYAQGQNWWSVKLQAAAGDSVSIKEASAERGLILLFMDPDCPVTQKYGASIREIYQSYRARGVNMIAVYPVVNGSVDKIRKFAEAYKYPFPHLLDTDLKFTKAIGASVTPEVFLMNADGNILYQGAIDNWFYELGRYRRVITRRYLKDALEAHLSGEAIAITQTEAIGCMIGTGMLHPSGHH